MSLAHCFFKLVKYTTLQLIPLTVFSLIKSIQLMLLNKQKLITAPVLEQANENKPYILKTDAGNYALRAVLIQGEGKEEHPIEYASRNSTDAYLITKETYEKKQTRHKAYKDQPLYKVGDLLWLNTHVLSSAENKHTSKFIPKKDGPYTNVRQLGATPYQIAHQDNLDIIRGTYHSPALTFYKGDSDEVPSPVRSSRRRGRPKKNFHPVVASRRLLLHRGRL